MSSLSNDEVVKSKGTNMLVDISGNAANYGQGNTSIESFNLSCDLFVLVMESLVIVLILMV